MEKGCHVQATHAFPFMEPGRDRDDGYLTESGVAAMEAVETGRWPTDFMLKTRLKSIDAAKNR